MEVEHTPIGKKIHARAVASSVFGAPPTPFAAPDAGSRRRRVLGRAVAYAPVALLGGPAVVRRPLWGPRPWPAAAKPRHRVCPCSSSSATTIVLCWEICASKAKRRRRERDGSLPRRCQRATAPGAARAGPLAPGATHAAPRAAARVGGHPRRGPLRRRAWPP